MDVLFLNCGVRLFYFKTTSLPSPTNKKELSINKKSSTSTIGFATLVLLALIWGSSFVLIKKGLLAFSPMQVASLRIGVAGLAFSPFFILNFKKIDWSKIFQIFIVGFAGSALPALLFSIAQTEVSSSVAGVLNSLTPLFVLIQGVLFYGLVLTKEKIWGVILGFVGAAFLILFGKNIASEGNQWYALFLVLATFSYALSVNTVQKHFQNMTPVNLSAAAYCLVAPAGITYLFFTDFLEVIKSHPDAMTSLGAVIILSLASTVIASVIFFKLVQMTSALFASMVAYLIPIIALVFGAMDGEQITTFHLIGMGMILFGVYITKKEMSGKEKNE